MDPSYNNSFGSFGSGDLVLAQEKKNSKKKLFLVLASIVVVALAAGLMLFFIKNNEKKELSNFQKLINYVVNGDENDATDITKKRAAGETYYLEDVYYSGDEESYNDVSSRVKEYLVRIQEEYDLIDTDVDSIKQVNEMLAVFDIQFLFEEYRFDGLVKIAYGNAAAFDNLENKINSISSTINGVIYNYIESAKELIQIANEIWPYYQEIECDIDNNEPSVCLGKYIEEKIGTEFNAESVESIIDMESSFEAAWSNSRQYADTLLSELPYSIYSIEDYKRSEQ